MSHTEWRTIRLKVQGNIAMYKCVNKKLRRREENRKNVLHLAVTLNKSLTTNSYYQKR